MTALPKPFSALVVAAMLLFVVPAALPAHAGGVSAAAGAGAAAGSGSGVGAGVSVGTGDVAALRAAVAAERARAPAARQPREAFQAPPSFASVQLSTDGRYVAYLRDDQFLRSPVEIGDAATASWQRDDLHLLRADLGRAALADSRPYQNP